MKSKSHESLYGDRYSRVAASACKRPQCNCTQPAANKEVPVRELLKLPGKVVSEAKSARPTDELKLTGYRIEELRLPRNLTVEFRGQQVVVDKAWRVTVKVVHSPCARFRRLSGLTIRSSATASRMNRCRKSPLSHSTVR